MQCGGIDAAVWLCVLVQVGEDRLGHVVLAL